MARPYYGVDSSCLFTFFCFVLFCSITQLSFYQFRKNKYHEKIAGLCDLIVMGSSQLNVLFFYNHYSKKTFKRTSFPLKYLEAKVKPLHSAIRGHEKYSVLNHLCFLSCKIHEVMQYLKLLAHYLK